MNKNSVGCVCCTDQENKRKVTCPSGTYFWVPANLAIGSSAWHISVSLYRDLAGSARQHPVYVPRVCNCNTFNGDYAIPVKGIDGNGLPFTSGTDPGRVVFPECDYYDWNLPGTYVGKLWREVLYFAITPGCSNPPYVEVSVSLAPDMLGPYNNHAEPPEITIWRYVGSLGGSIDLTQPLVMHPPTSMTDTPFNFFQNILLPEKGRAYECQSRPAAADYPIESTQADLTAAPSITVFLA